MNYINRELSKYAYNKINHRFQNIINISQMTYEIPEGQRRDLLYQIFKKVDRTSIRRCCFRERSVTLRKQAAQSHLEAELLKSDRTSQKSQQPDEGRYVGQPRRRLGDSRLIKSYFEAHSRNDIRSFFRTVYNLADVLNKRVENGEYHCT